MTLCYAYSVLDSNGSFESIIGSVNDITALKCVQDVHKQKTEDTVQAKYQQENLVDVTPYEMRSPLDAIIASGKLMLAMTQKVVSSTYTHSNAHS